MCACAVAARPNTRFTGGNSINDLSETIELYPKGRGRISHDLGRRFYRHRRFRREGQPKPRIGIEGLTALLSEEI